MAVYKPQMEIQPCLKYHLSSLIYWMIDSYYVKSPIQNNHKRWPTCHRSCKTLAPFKCTALNNIGAMISTFSLWESIHRAIHASNQTLLVTGNVNDMRTVVDCISHSAEQHNSLYGSWKDFMVTRNNICYLMSRFPGKTQNSPCFTSALPIKSL